jgi:hypothetical protein
MAEARVILVSDSHLNAGRLGARPPVALITHKPITTNQTELAAAPSYRFRPADARERLARLFGATPPALVMSGHLQLTLTVDLPDPYHGRLTGGDPPDAGR